MIKRPQVGPDQMITTPVGWPLPILNQSSTVAADARS
jgi:hypothetical protein